MLDRPYKEPTILGRASDRDANKFIRDFGHRTLPRGEFSVSKRSSKIWSVAAIAATVVVPVIGADLCSDDSILLKGFMSTAQMTRSAMPSVAAIKCSNGVGTGFFISSDGYMVTAEHVIDDCPNLRVVLADGRNYQAEVIGISSDVDTAVLKIKGHGFKPVHWGDSTKIRVGDPVMLVGDGLDEGVSPKYGHVTAMHVARMKSGNSPYMDFIKTDAAMNHGDSGGPIFSENDSVIAVANELPRVVIELGPFGLVPISINSGNSFATSIADVRKAAEDIIKFRTVRMGVLSVDLQDAKASDGLHIGAKVNKIDDPYDFSGLKKYDVITKFNDVPIKSATDCLAAFFLTHPDDVVPIDVMRGKGFVHINAVMRRAYKPSPAVAAM